MLLDEEIPLATSHINGGDHGHVYGNDVLYYDDDDPFKYPYTSSPVSAFSFHSFGGSSSSLFSGMHSSSDTGSPTPLTLPFEDFQSTVPSVRDKVNDSLVDELGLAVDFSKMYIANQQQNSNGLSFSTSGNNPISVHNKHGNYNNFNRDFFSSGGFEPPFPRNPTSHRAELNSALSGLGQDYKMVNLFRSQTFPGWHETMLSQLNSFNRSMDPPRYMRQLIIDDYCRGSLETALAATMSRNPVVDVSLYGQKYGMNLIEERGMPRLPDYSLCTNLRPYMSIPDSLHYGFPLCNARAVPVSNARIPQENLDTVTSEGSFILQGESLNYVAGSRGSTRSRCWNAVGETGLDIMLPKYNVNSLAEARGCIYLIAKDQYGCRFLQRMFDEGTPEDVQVIFNEIIDHVVELMVNPFGNYLMQKLLDVCSEEQRMQIILMVTGEKGQLVGISLNIHGTRVVQKLIETLKTWQQISLVVSALEPGFLALIKDLNGNHVVQHCLQCLSNEDNRV
ncbi:putative armadillo-like helical protein [Lupinus albus]|uniref:Putative armadillo-like helical protein n=1 Tax=Lupinus albus TaxID=3870 RepID=A0A6A4P3M8_LUPAL|nr:putative armadillo-like helical protein [Lupinus albus]